MMKKILTITVAALFSVASFSQESADNALKIKMCDGDSLSYLLSSIKDITIEEVTPMSMDIQVSDVTESSMTIDFPKPEGCSFWLMCIQKEELTGTMQERRTAIWQKYNDRFDDSRYFKIPNLDPGTTYHIYALLFDETGVAAGLSHATATTLEKQANDEFSINVNETTKPYASWSFLYCSPSARPKAQIHLSVFLRQVQRRGSVHELCSIAPECHSPSHSDCPKAPD